MTGVWVTNDTISSTRMNEKTIFQGTGAAIAALGTTYSGMLAFCTSTGSGFTKDVLYERNTADTAWNPVGLDQLPYLKLSTTIGDYSQPSAVVATSEDLSDEFTDDFSSYADTTAGDAAWPTNDTTNLRVNPTTDVLTANLKAGNFVGRVYYDLGAGVVSNTSWRLRWKWVIGTVTQGSDADNVHFLFGISNNTESNTPQDCIAIQLRINNSAKRYAAYDVDNGNSEGGGDASFSHTVAAETIYVEILRISATAYTINLYSDSAYTTLIESQSGTCASTTDTLRYIKAWYIGAAGADHVFNTTIDNIVFSTDGYPILAIDNSTSTKWKSDSEATPAIYVDLASTREIVAVALNIDKTATTVTAIKIRASTDTTFTDAENIAYVNISDFTDDTWRFLPNNFLADNRRYVQIIGVGTGVLAINEIKVRYGVSDLIKILTHKHRTRTTDSADAFVDSD